MSRLACSLALVVGALGCGKSSDAESPPAAKAKAPADLTTASEPFVVDGGTYEVVPNLKVPEAWVDCRIGSDCVALQGGCCDHCNGGVITAVNKKYEGDLQPYLERFGCEGRDGCTEMACDAPAEHEIVCMTRACIIVDLEDGVRDRLWGRE